MKYPLYDQTWQGFEDLVIAICRDILGIGVKKFSDGRDGGRDAWFEGTASKYPSGQNPWNGNFCIQAKHSSSINSSCSDSNFSSITSKTSLLNKELARLKKLKGEQSFDNYLLFTNRKLTGDQNSKMQTWFRKELEITNVDFFGIETIESYITEEIAFKTKLFDLLFPLRFYERDIQDVIVGFADFNQSDRAATSINLSKRQFLLIDKAEKNRLNRLSEEYFAHIKNKSLQYFQDITTFLKDPRHQEFTEKYENTASDLDARIALERNQYAGFESIIEMLIAKIVDSDPERLRPQRRVVRVFLHFMYFNCDIGRIE